MNVSPWRGFAITEQQSPVLRDNVDGVGTITLNRPESLNSMSVQLMDELRDSLIAFSEDMTVRCVVLKGAGRAFSSGGDIGDIARRQKDTAESASLGALIDSQYRTMLRHVEAVQLLKSMPKPTVALLQGWAVGGGMSLALAADFRVMASSARMRAGFAARSLSGDFGISALLIATIGAARAREILMLDTIVTVQLAQSLGLVTLTCDDADLDTVSADFIRSLATGPTIAYGRMKANLNAAETLTFAESLAVESMNQRVSANTADAREAGAAFAEKRDPRFTGR